MPKVDQALAILADRLNTTVPHLWEVMIRQCKVIAVRDSLVFLLTLVIVVCVINGARKSWRTWHDTEPPAYFDWFGEGGGFPWTMALVFSGAAFLAAFCEAVDTVPTAILNPEAYAIQQILRLLGK